MATDDCRVVQRAQVALVAEPSAQPRHRYKVAALALGVPGESNGRRSIVLFLFVFGHLNISLRSNENQVPLVTCEQSYKNEEKKVRRESGFLMSEECNEDGRFESGKFILPHHTRFL